MYEKYLNMEKFKDFEHFLVKVNERTEYHKAMNKANNENDYTDIKNFYRYKICDSIIELDINNKVREEKDITRTKQKRD